MTTRTVPLPIRVLRPDLAYDLITAARQVLEECRPVVSDLGPDSLYERVEGLIDEIDAALVWAPQA
jgi:hypothetical protein